MFRDGGMDAACWAVVYGYTISPTKDFCYFLSLKSKAMPIQMIFENHFHLRAVTVVALAIN
jgi:hypothetical protein